MAMTIEEARLAADNSSQMTPQIQRAALAKLQRFLRQSPADRKRVLALCAMLVAVPRKH